MYERILQKASSQTNYFWQAFNARKMF